MSDERQERMQRIGMMDEAEDFIRSSLGRYLIERAERERDEAVDALKEADAEDPKRIRELQNKVFRAESFQYWIAQLVMEGKQALEQEMISQQSD